MSAENKMITLYDIPSRTTPSYCWSLNPWKARASLNFKGLAYRTSWTEYPDIAPTFKALGIPPNAPGSMFEYSCPAAQFPDGTFVMDSRKVAERLEALQPEPSLRIDRGEVIDRAQAAVLAVMGSLGAVLLPRVPAEILGERSAEYFYETRKTRFGMPLQEVPESELGRTAWERAGPAWADLAKLLKEDGGGPFVEGSEAGFADLVIAGFWAMLKVTGEDDLFGRAMGLDEVFKVHWGACEKWFERNDH